MAAIFTRLRKRLRNLKTRRAVWPALLIVLSQLKNISDLISHWQNAKLVWDVIRGFAVTAHVQLAMLVIGLIWLAALAIWPQEQQKISRPAPSVEAPLADRVTRLAEEIRTFLEEQEPAPQIDSMKDLRPALAVNAQRLPRIHDGYMRRFHGRVEQIIYELGERDVRDYALNELANKPAHSDDDIRAIATKLAALGVELTGSGHSLRDRTFGLCRELRAFLATQGSEPTVDSIWKANMRADEFKSRYDQTIGPWRNKFQAGFWRRFENSLVDIRHEFAELGHVDDELDKALSAAAKSPEVENVRATAERLTVLAAKLD